MVLKNRLYDSLKFVALVFLPAAAASYFSLAQVWELPNAEKVVGTITIIDTFLGVLLKSSSSLYNKTGTDTAGDLYVNVDPDDGQKYLSLGVNHSVEAMTAKDRVTLRVVDKTDPS